MAKAIKFNLRCDGVSIRTLEDLRNHFCVQDILEYYNTGILARWLNVQGFSEEVEKLKEIDTKNNEELLIELANVLGVDIDDGSIRDAIAIIEYENNGKERYELYAKGILEESKVVDDYIRNYKDLVNQIVKKKDDFSAIKAMTAILVKNYKKLLCYDYQNLFHKMYHEAPLALLSFVVTKELRGYYIPEWVATEDGVECWDVEEKKIADPIHSRRMKNKREMYDMLCDLVTTEKDIRILVGDRLKCNSQNTSGQWSEVEPDSRKKYLIFSLQQGCKVRSLKSKDEVYTSSDINRLFVVLDGIEYSNGYNYKLLYMEV